ncbi:MAG: hypothetical protein LC115_02240 [Bacteroidia bacterium]|nr:hypothetical protein [Bacteroidia bacterium]
MSELNTFRIIEKGDNFVKIKVTIVHPDEHYICRTKNFALQIILELYENIIEGYIYNSDWCGYPFTEEESKSLINPLYEEPLAKLRTLLRGEKIPITEEEYNRRSEESDYQYQDKRGISVSGNGDNYYLDLYPDYFSVCQTADKLIEKVELISFNNYPHWFDTFEAWLDYQTIYDFPNEAYEKHEDDKEPTYQLRITVTPEGLFLLGHVVVRSFWDSAAYDFELETRESYLSKYDSQDLQYKSKPQVKYSSKELTTWWQSLSEDWKRTLQINLFMQSNFLPIQVVLNLKGFYVNEKFETLFPDIQFKKPSLKELRNITQMKALFANGSALINLEPLLFLLNLKILDAETCRLTDISALSHLKQLEYLCVVDNDDLKDLSVIKTLESLKYTYYDEK